MSGLKELKSLINALRERESYIWAMDGTNYDPSTDSEVKEDRLHQDRPNMTEEESALYAANHPGIEAHWQKMSKDLDRIIEKLK